MPRHATPFHLTLALDPRDPRPASRLAAAVVRAIADGQLHDGDPLPSTRSLAAHLGVARSVVVAAYEELTAAGFLVATPGSATRVGPGARDASLAGAYAHPGPVTTDAGKPTSPRHAIRLDLRPGHPDSGLIDAKDWARAWRRAAAGALEPAAVEVTSLRPGYGFSFHAPLRNALAGHLRRNRAVVCAADDIFLFPGVNAALRALVRLVGDPRRTLAFEEPGYLTGRRALTGAGARVRPVSVDAEGLRVGDLTDDWGCYVTPAHQYPLGSRMSVARRTALLAWAAKRDALILEDDYDGEFRYDRQPVGSLQGLCPDRVAYLGSTSKSMTQVMRLGWMVLPEDLVDPVIAAAGGQQFFVDAIAQLTLADFIASGQYDRHIRRMRARYRRRRDALTDALSSFDVGIGGLAAGVNMLLTLPDGAEPDVLRRAGDAGIALSGLARMRHPDAGPDVPEQDGVVIGFAAPAEHAFGPAVDALCRILEASGLAG